jgi:hypothetical protein
VNFPAFFVCLPLLFAPRPKTPLRVFCIAAFEFLARLRGTTLGKRRLAIALACDFGSLCDQFYDHGALDTRQYRSLRRELRQIAPERATSRYLRLLRQSERHRPILPATHPNDALAILSYRTSVLDLSLRWMQEVSGLTLSAQEFQLLLDLVSLMQIADDLLDWKDDLARSCPSYVTAYLTPNTNVALPIRAHADAILHRIARASQPNPAALPFALAGAITWAFIVALLKLRCPR